MGVHRKEKKVCDLDDFFHTTWNFLLKAMIFRLCGSNGKMNLHAHFYVVNDTGITIMST